MHSGTASRCPKDHAIPAGKLECSRESTRDSVVPLAVDETSMQANHKCLHISVLHLFHSDMEELSRQTQKNIPIRTKHRISGCWVNCH